MRALMVGLLFVLSSCGYHTPGADDAWVGGEAKTVYVELFDNLTAEPYLDNYLTDEVVRELARSRVLVLTEHKAEAALSLTGSVDSFQSRALAYGSDDRITGYRAVMSASVQILAQESGQVIWKDQLERSEDYLATVDKNQQIEAQSLAARLVAKRLAEDLHARLLNSF